MAFHTTNFLFYYFMPEPCLKFALTQRCCRDTHGFLTTSQQYLYPSELIHVYPSTEATDIGAIWRECCTVQRGLCRIGFQNCEGLRFVKLRDPLGFIRQSSESSEHDRHTRAVLSLLLVMKYVRSGLS